MCWNVLPSLLHEPSHPYHSREVEKKKSPLARAQYSSVRMIVSTRVVTAGLAGSSDPAASVRS